MNTYKISREWFEYTYAQDDIKPSHTSLFFFIINLFNRLNWNPVIGLPSVETMNAIGIKNYKTYKKVLDKLAEIGAINIVERSRNQYTATTIELGAMVKNTKANQNSESAMVKNTKAKLNLTECYGKKYQSTTQSTTQSIVDIIKLINLQTLKPIKVEDVSDSSLLNKISSYISSLQQENKELAERLTKQSFKENKEEKAKPHDLAKIPFYSDYVHIVGQMNQICKKSFVIYKKAESIKSDGKYKDICARRRKGASVEQMIAVVRFKAAEWVGEEKTKKWLRTSTLFGDKWANYVDQIRNKNIQEENIKPIASTYSIPGKTEEEVDNLIFEIAYGKKISAS